MYTSMPTLRILFCLVLFCFFVYFFVSEFARDYVIDVKWEAAKKGKMLQKEFYTSSAYLAGVGRPRAHLHMVYAGLHMM